MPVNQAVSLRFEGPRLAPSRQGRRVQELTIMHLGWTPRGPARHIARVLFLLALLSGWLTGVPSWAGVVQAVRVHGDRIVVTFDTPVTQASAFVLAGPQRIALDVAGAEPGRISLADGAVAKIRQGAQGDGARIVFDL